MSKATQTLTLEPESSSNGSGESLVIRWVVPQPLLAPTWLGAPRTTFGRDVSGSVYLDSEYVSRQHAVITRSGPLWLVSDLSSKNGVVINGQAVREAVLSPGDVVRLGNFVGVCLMAPPGADLSAGVLFPDIYGGRRLRGVVARMGELATTELSVVLEGETGTGKERFARALHARSGRQGHFHAVNCSVYSKSMAAAELFGYRRGAFTGAEVSSVGHIRAAEGGTLLLDELIELAPDVQAMLLRALENREVLPLGEPRPVSIHVRFLAATQIPLQRAVAEGTLRADLRSRLEGAVLSLPSLRECREAIPEMFLALFERHANYRPELRAAFAERLCLHDWPLNVRELDTVARRIAAWNCEGAALGHEAIEQAWTPSRDDVSERRDQEPSLSTTRRGKSAYGADEVNALASALTRCDGNLSKAAAELGITRSKAYRMLRAGSKKNTRGTKPSSSD